jgi:serine/threonine-protein kinase ULK4
LEAFLTHIYRALAAATPLKDKVNVLAYFETLCADTTAANVLINSSLTMLFVRMLRNGRAPLLRVRLAGVLGLLVRHATFIAEELAATQVCACFGVCLLARLSGCTLFVCVCV